MACYSSAKVIVNLFGPYKSYEIDWLGYDSDYFDSYVEISLLIFKVKTGEPYSSEYQAIIEKIGSNYGLSNRLSRIFELYGPQSDY